MLTNSRVIAWNSKGLSEETVKPPATSDNNLGPRMDFSGTKIQVKFDGNCLKQEKISLIIKLF